MNKPGRSSVIVAALTLVATAVAPSAGAQPRSSAPERDRLYLHTSVGTGFGLGKLTYSDLSAEAMPRRLTFHSDLRGVFIALDGAVGYAPRSGLAIGLEIRGALYPSLTATSLPYTGLDVLLIGYAGSLVDWYPEPSGPFHVMFGAGGVVADFGGGQNDIGAADNIVNLGELQGMFGISTHAEAGYSWRTLGGLDYGPSIRAEWTHFTSEHARSDVLAVAAAFALSWF
jgi:hypothetical protein